MKVNQVDRDLIFIADDQYWTQDDIEILKRDYNVFFDKNGVIAIRRLERSGMNPLIQISVEDDGFIQFRENHTLEIDSYWVSNLMDTLERAMMYSIDLNEGSSLEIYFKGEWCRGKIVSCRDGMITIETDDGRKVWCNQDRTDLYRSAISEN